MRPFYIYLSSKLNFKFTDYVCDCSRASFSFGYIFFSTLFLIYTIFQLLSLLQLFYFHFYTLLYRISDFDLIASTHSVAE